MKINITTKQLISTRRLFKNLDDFQKGRMGSITEVEVMIHPLLKDTVLVKYVKSYSLSGNMVTEFKIASIDNDGKIDFIEEKFKDAFEQAAFLSVCQPFNIEDQDEYQKIN